MKLTATGLVLTAALMASPVYAAERAEHRSGGHIGHVSSHNAGHKAAKKHRLVTHGAGHRYGHSGHRDRHSSHRRHVYHGSHYNHRRHHHSSGHHYSYYHSSHRHRSHHNHLGEVILGGLILGAVVNELSDSGSSSMYNQPAQIPTTRTVTSTTQYYREGPVTQYQELPYQEEFLKAKDGRCYEVEYRSDGNGQSRRILTETDSVYCI